MQVTEGDPAKKACKSVVLHVYMSFGSVLHQNIKLSGTAYNPPLIMYINFSISGSVTVPTDYFAVADVSTAAVLVIVCN